MSAHTPGPFDASMFTQAIEKVVGEYRSAWRKAESGSIGKLEQAEQYARLIAAAPELLEALEAMIEHSDFCRGHHACETPFPGAQARGAIAKARGES